MTIYMMRIIELVNIIDNPIELLVIIVITFHKFIL